MDNSNAMKSSIIAHAMRLLPGEDLYKSIEKYAKENHIKAGCIITCVGSLKEINIRLANSTNFMKNKECYEITSLVGCISCNDRLHLHITICDKGGIAYGGHLIEEGNIIYTTAEIVIGDMPNIMFSQAHCSLSGWNELKIAAYTTEHMEK